MDELTLPGTGGSPELPLHRAGGSQSVCTDQTHQQTLQGPDFPGCTGLFLQGDWTAADESELRRLSPCFVRIKMLPAHPFGRRLEAKQN